MAPEPQIASPEFPAGESPPQQALPSEPPPTTVTVEAPRAKRAYKRHKPLRITRAQRQAASANLAKAREALRARGWPHSELQRAAARKNIKKAQAAVSEHGLPTTEARLGANRANLAKANAALRAQGYPRNEKQIAASRANLLKAWEVSHARDPISYKRCHAHKLKHGLYADLLDELMMQYFGQRQPRRTKAKRTSPE
ncbi:MAG: hypothetical protein LAO07_13785 [Acidobacteriia bacterium]|nr:hypothetical protein [Terriglobia bacterium]